MLVSLLFFWGIKVVEEGRCENCSVVQKGTANMLPSAYPHFYVGLVLVCVLNNGGSNCPMPTPSLMPFTHQGQFIWGASSHTFWPPIYPSHRGSTCKRYLSGYLNWRDGDARAHLLCSGITVVEFPSGGVDAASLWFLLINPQFYLWFLLFIGVVIYSQDGHGRLTREAWCYLSFHQFKCNLWTSVLPFFLFFC